MLRMMELQVLELLRDQVDVKKRRALILCTYILNHGGQIGESHLIAVVFPMVNM